MDLFNVRAIEVTKLAMDGLSKRQEAIASNAANAMTPDYQRKMIGFEDQLRNIIAKDDVRKDLRMQNSMAYSNDRSYNPMTQNIAQKLPQEQMMYIQQTGMDAKGYAPEIIKDNRWIDYGNGNNVNIEEEMMDMAKTGSQYSVLATVEGRFMTGLLDVVKGGGA